MSLPTEQLFGQPINPIDSLGSNLLTTFENIWLTATGQQLFAPNGINGIADGTLHPASAINYLMNKRSIIERSAFVRPLFRLADRDLNIVGELTGELAMDYEELMQETGNAKYVVHWENWLVDYMVNLTAVEEDLHLIIDPFPENTSWRWRWGGKIHTINIERKEDGTSIVEIQAVSNREHAKRLLYGANPIFPPEFQLPRMWILPGPTRSVLFISGMINLARLFLPGLSFITNIANPLSWLNPLTADALLQVNPLDWPIQCAFVNTITDGSRWTVLGATWTTWHDATQDILKDAGVMMRAYTFLANEDVDSPHTELVSLVQSAIGPVGDLIATLLGTTPDVATGLQTDVESVLRPSRNCVVFSFEDKSGVTGPTGTALDGLLSLIGATLDDLISSVLINSETGLTLDGEPVVDLQGSNFPIAESILGVAPAPPKVIWKEGQFTAIIDAKHVLNKGSPRTVMTGGRSPALVNESISFAIKYGLSQLSDLINPAFGSTDVGPFGASANTAWQFTPTVGLDSIYQGQLDNCVLAWERVTNPVTALWGGDLDFQEYFERGSSVAYTLASILTLQTALWKTRAYQGLQAVVLNGLTWTINIDTGLGDRNGFEFDGVIYVDQIYGIKSAVEKGKPLATTLTVGENKDKADPLGRVIRAAQGAYMLIGAILGGETIFA
jgi:hypothetical protein